MKQGKQIYEGSVAGRVDLGTLANMYTDISQKAIRNADLGSNFFF